MAIIYWTRNIAGFMGAQRFLIGGQPFVNPYIASPEALGSLMAQTRSTMRFVFSRVHGRVN